MLVKDAISDGYLTVEMVSIIPHECSYCGTDLEIDIQLTHLYCPNDFCTRLLANRLERMAKLLGAKGFGEEICLDIIKKHNLKYIHQVFDVLGERLTNKYGDVRNLELSVEIANGRNTTLSTAFRTLGIPRIDSSSEKIFGTYNTLDDFYNDFEINPVEFIVEKLNRKSEGDAVHDIVIKLNKYRELIYTHVAKFVVEKVAKDSLIIAITGGINNFASKEVFVKSTNDLYGEKVKVVFNNSLTSETSLLIAESSSSSSKYSKAKKLGKPIMTSQEFLAYMRETYGE